MAKLTNNDIREAIQELNNISKLEYVPHFAYGMKGLHQLFRDDSGSVRDFLGLTDGRTLYEQIRAIITWYNREKPHFLNDFNRGIIETLLDEKLAAIAIGSESYDLEIDRDEARDIYNEILEQIRKH